MAEGTVHIPYSKIEPLCGNNYHVWCLKISAILRSQKLFKEVLEDSEPPESHNPDSNEYKVREIWDKKNADAFGIIIINLTDEIAGMFIGETKASNVWEKLRNIYAGNAEDRRIDVGLELKNIKMRDNETVDSFLTRARNIASESAILGQIITERELVYHVVRGLHPKLEHIAMVLRTQRSAKMEDIQRALKEEELRQDQQENSKFKHSGICEKAFKAKNAPHEFRKKSNISKSCYLCGKVGHLAKDCWHRKDHQRGHETKYKPNPQSRNRVNPPNKHKQNHAFHTCFSTYEEEGIETTRWSLDSGSTSHMSNKFDWLTDVSPYKTKIKLAESGREIESEAKGNVLVSTLLHDGTMNNICIKDVLYVPNLRCNLLSVHSLAEKGNIIIFKNENVKILAKGGNIIAEPKIINNMYILETIPRTDACMVTNPSQRLAVREENNIGGEVTKFGQSDKTLWHLRMGHLNDEYMEILKSNDMVRGLDFKSEKLKPCEDCIMGKMARDPFKPVETDKGIMPLNLIHVDLCGPMPIPTLGGAKYMLVIVDSYSRYTTIYLLKAKHEAFENFVNYVNRIENELGLKVKNVRSDNGSEFVCDRFEKYFAERGIHHERTVAYTPQSNGVAERANRTLLDKTRTMLLSANLPLQFWGEAAMTATYLKNRSPTKKIGNITPIEKWSGRKPSVSYLKVFGCTAYYHIPKPQRNKLEQRAKKGIFVGYSCNRKAYRIFDPVTNGIVETQSVKFNEGLKGSLLLDENNSTDCNDYLQIEYPVSVQRGENAEAERETTFKEYSTQTEGAPEEPSSSRGSSPESNASQERLNIKKKGRKSTVPKGVGQIKTTEDPVRKEEKRTAVSASSERIRQQNEANISIRIEEEIPKTFDEAISSRYADKWKAAMDEELSSLKEHEVWEIVPRTQADKVIKSKWIFSRKIENETNTPRYKARLVAMGHAQRPGIDFYDTYAPVLKLESFRILMSLTVQLNWKIKQYDVKTAYLYGELNEDIYMEPPTDSIANEACVLKLKKSLYGLPQSGRCWNMKLDESLKNIGLTPLPNDPCIYKLEKDGKVFYMSVYVDDMLTFGSDEIIIDEVMAKVKAVYQLREMDAPFKFLGIDIVREDDCKIRLSQERYTKEILKKYKMEFCNPVSTPGNLSINTDDFESSPPVDQRTYQEMLGSLMYLNLGTRPDIAHSISKLAQYSNDPREVHMMCLKRVLRYLKGTVNHSLHYTRSENPKVTISTDASWGNARNSKSFSGYVMKIGNNVVSWKCQKQSVVALSTCESELMAICEGVRECKWATGLLEDLPIGEETYHPVVVESDSKSAIEWIHKNNSNAKTKHISRRFYFIRDEIQNGNVILVYVKSSEMDADFLTKHVPTDVLESCIRRLGLVEFRKIRHEFRIRQTEKTVTAI